MNNQIANWDALSEEEKKKATELLKGQPGLNPVTNHPAAKFFEENHWVKIENVITPEVAKLLYHHVQLETQRLATLEEIHGVGNVDENMHGTFTDKQAPGDFSKYGDPIFDALLSILKENMEMYTGKQLVPTYSYHRLYTQGTELTRHKDRPSCEISTTLCLGYDNSNVDKTRYPDWDWPMFVGPGNGEEGTSGLPIHLKPGDMIIYRGCEVEHWREPLMGLNHAQVFLHYNEVEGQYDIPFDGRPMLGMSGEYRSKDAIDKQDVNNESLKEDSINSNGEIKFKKVIY